MKRNVTFKRLTSSQSVLFPRALCENIPDNHPARIVDRVVDGLDISPLLALYKGGGTSSYHPKMMLKVLFYSYLSNIYSCRKIERALTENICLMWLSGNSTPDYRTINYFRGHRLKAVISNLFSEVVKLLQSLGCVTLDVQYIDGTKIEACANRYTFVWRKSVEKNKKKLEDKIQGILEMIERQTESDDATLEEEDTLPVVNSKMLEEKLAALNEKLKDADKATKKALEKVKKEDLPKLAHYEHQLDTIGKGRNSYCKTDPDATFMRLKDDHMKNGQLKPAYNTQISTENQFITHYSIHQTAGDTTTLPSHLDGFEKQNGKQSKVAVTDAGYGSQENYQIMLDKNIEAYVKDQYFHRDQKPVNQANPFLVPNWFYNAEEDFYVCPMGQKMTKVGVYAQKTDNNYPQEIHIYQARRCDNCPLRGLCHKEEGNKTIHANHQLNLLRNQARQRLNSEEGIKHRKKRCIEPEAVFGQLKSNNKFNRFTHRGKEKVSMEFGLMAIGHNLRKLSA